MKTHLVKMFYRLNYFLTDNNTYTWVTKLYCQLSDSRIPRHAVLKEIIYQALSTVNVPAILKPSGTSRTNGKRADGITLIPCSIGLILSLAHQQEICLHSSAGGKNKETTYLQSLKSKPCTKCYPKQNKETHGLAATLPNALP